MDAVFATWVGADTHARLAVILMVKDENGKLARVQLNVEEATALARELTSDIDSIRSGQSF